MRDNYGDLIDLKIIPETGNVILTVTFGWRGAQASLTPDKARKLARKLNKAAGAAERSK